MAANEATPDRMAGVTGEIRALQYGRGLAALMVVLFHTEELVWKKFPQADHIAYFAFGSSGVHFFFILSGFIIYHAHRNDLGKPQSWTLFWKKRLIRIVPVFWLIVVPLGLIYLAVPTLGTDRALTTQNFLLDLFFIPRPDKLTLPPAWTLQHEFVFYAIFSVMILNVRAGLAALICWQFACVFNTVFGIFPTNYLLPSNKFFGSHNFGFAAGLIIALVFQNYDLRNALPSIRIAAVLATAGLAGMAFAASASPSEGASDEARSALWTNLIYFLIYACIILYLLAAPIRLPGMLARILAGLGSASYVLYLSHEPVSSTYVKLVQSARAEAYMGPVSIFVLILAATVGTAILIHLIVEKPVTAALRRVFLARPNGTIATR